MADEGLALTEDSLRRVERVVRRVEAQAAAEAGPGGLPGALPQGAVSWRVQITATTLTDGTMPGQWYSYDPAADAYAVQDTIRVKSPNAATLVVGKYYRGLHVGFTTAGVAVFEVDDVGVAGDAGGAAFSGARLYNSGNIGVADLATQSLTWDSEYYDTDAYHNGSSNTERLTIPADGYYLVGVQLIMVGIPGTGNVQVDIMSAARGAIASAVVADGAGGAVADFLSCSTAVHLTAGDYLTADLTPSTGSGITSGADGQSAPVFWIVRLGT